MKLPPIARPEEIDAITKQMYALGLAKSDIEQTRQLLTAWNTRQLTTEERSYVEGMMVKAQIQQHRNKDAEKIGCIVLILVAIIVALVVMLMRK